MGFVLSSLMCYLAMVVAAAEDNSLEPSAVEPVGLVGNLSVRAIVHDVKARTLQLYINWTAPTEGRQPTGYLLKVKSLNETRDHCELMTAAEEIDNVTWTWLVVPREVSSVKGDPRVMHECAYNVRVESQPYDGVHAAEVNYTVPDRVGPLWSCRNESLLPIPKRVDVSVINSSAVGVSWFTDFNPARLGYNFAVSVGRHVGGPAELFQRERRLLVSGGSRKVVAAVDVSAAGWYNAEVSVVDARGCQGPPAEYRFRTVVANDSKLATSSKPRQMETSTYSSDTTEDAGLGLTDMSFNVTDPPGNKTVPDPITRSRTELLLVVAVPALSLAVALALAVAMLYHKCGWIRRKLGEGRMQPVYTWRGVYKPVSIDSSSCRFTRMTFPALQERSVLYVEKEIEEAKARGEVDTFEVSYDRLQLGRQIGKGDFGRVFLARAEAVGGVPGFRTVAVKKLKQRATAEEVEEFQAEIAMLKRAGRHANVVEMVGCCTLRPPLCILMEFVPCGDLLHYLRRLRVEYERRTGAALPFSSTMSRPQPRYIDLVLSSDSESSYVQPEARLSVSSGRPSITETEWSLVSSEGAPSTPTERPQPRLDYVLDPAELQSFAVQIARGMSHLEQRRITHRDLAARNILIDEHKTLKISDFGLSRSGIYVNTRGKKVPLRWLSVEAIRDNLYSSKSDVWAYAIVLWEIGTLGGFPYPTVADHDLLRFLLEGRRLDKPDNCTDELYSLMLMCWSHCADDRPSFATISKHLEGALGRRRVYVDFGDLRPDYAFPPTEQEPPA